MAANLNDYINGPDLVDGFGKPTDYSIKQQKVEAAAKRKKDFLAALNVRDTQLRDAYDKTLAGRLGLDRGDLPADAVNLGASAFAGTVRMAGNVAAMPNSIGAMVFESLLDDEDKQAIARYEQGKATPEDLQRINTPKQHGDITQSGTPLEHYKESQRNREWARNINEAADYSGLVDQTKRTNLTDSLASNFDENWEKTKQGDIGALGKLIFNAGAAGVSNPGAVLELMAENAPQLLVGGLAGAAGKAALGTTNAGYAMDVYQKGVEAYQKKNGGALPSDAERAEIAVWAATTFLAEHASDKVGLAAGKMFGKPADAGVGAARTSLLKAARGTATGTLGASATEAATETYQTFAENQAEGKDSNALELYQAGAMGGMAGGGLSGGMRGLHEVGKLASQASADGAKRAADRGIPTVDAETQTNMDKAAEAGDVSEYTDHTKPGYQPVQAIRSLIKASEKEGTTDEDKQTKVAKAQEVLAGIDTAIEAKKTEAGGLDTKQINAEIKELQEALALDGLEQDDITYFNEAIAEKQQELAELKTNKNADSEAKKYSNTIASLEKQREAAVKILSKFNKDSAATIDGTTELDTIEKNESPEAVQTAASRVINLSMANPDQIDTDTAVNLSTNAALSKDQQEYFKNFAAARNEVMKAQDMDLVSQDVFFGNDKLKLKGLKQHQDTVSQAVNAGNKAVAEQGLRGLEAFTEGHQSKADALAAAFETATTTGETVQLKKLAGKWRVLSTPMDTKELKAQGGYEIHQNSGKFVAAVTAEANTLQAGLAQAKSGVKMVFGKPTTAAQNEAQDVSKEVVTPTSTQPTKTDPEPSIKKEKSAEAKTEAPSGVSEANAATEVQSKPKAVLNKERESSVVAEQAPALTPVSQAPQAGAAPALATNVVKDVPSVASTESQSTEVNSQSTVDDSVDTQSTGVDLEVNKDSTSNNLQSTTLTGPEAPTKTTYSGLKILSKSLKGKVVDYFKNADRAAGYLSQSNNTGKDAFHVGLRPFVDIANFAGNWVNGRVDIKKYLPEGKTLNTEEQASLDSFQSVLRPWFNTLHGTGKVANGVFKKADRGNGQYDQRYRDVVQDMYDEDGNIDRNVIGATIYGAYSWLADAVFNDRYKDQENIRKMHSLDEEGSMTSELRKKLREVQAFEDTVANEIGRTIVNVLGIKAKPNAPEDYMAKLVAGLGAHALVLLEMEGLITAVEITHSELANEMSGFPEPENKKVFNTYIKLNKVAAIVDGRTVSVLPDLAQQIKDATKGSQMILDKVFKSQKEPVEASFEPTKFRQKFAKGTNQRISMMQARVLNAAQQIPHTMIEGMWNAKNIMGNEAILKMAGKQPVDEFTHINNKDRIETQNSNLEGQLGLMDDLMASADKNGDGIKQKFYVAQEVWRNFRVGITARNLNMQSSKIHRYFFTRPEFKSTIDMNNVKQMEQFKLAFAQAMGERIDAVDSVDTIDWFNKFLENPDNDALINSAVALYRATQANDPTMISEGQKNLLTDFAASKEKLQTFQALLDFGQYMYVKDNGIATKFVTHMLVGVDGKTNGPILAHLALGAGSVKHLMAFLARGGMFSLESGYRNFNNWKANEIDGNDLYEDLMKSFYKHLEATPRSLVVLETLFGKLYDTNENVTTSAGRKLIKTPLTSFAFGSSIAKSLENMGYAFKDKFIENIELIAQGDDKALDISELIDVFNSLLPVEYQLKENTTIDELLKLDFESGPGKKAMDIAMENFMDQLEEPLDITMRSYFAVFMERRNAVTAATQLSFEVFYALYKDVVAREINKLAAAGEIKVTDKGVPVHGLSREQNDKLKKAINAMLPQVHSMYSQESGNKRESLMLAKKERKLNPNNINNTKLGKTVKRKGSGTFNVKAMEEMMVAPGSAGLPYMMHSLDSWIMHWSITNMQTLNVHDEGSNGVLNTFYVAQRLNKGTWQAMLNYSPMFQAAEGMKNIFEILASMIENNMVSKEAMEEIKKAIKATQISPQKIMRQHLEADQIRLEVLSQAGAFDQYTWEGGEYQITDEDRQQALINKQELEAGFAQREQALIAAIKTFRNYTTNKKRGDFQLDETVEDAVMEAAVPIEELKPLKDKDIGVTQEVVQELVQAVAQTPELKEVMEPVVQAVQQGSEATAAVEAQNGTATKAQIVQSMIERIKNIPKGLLTPLGVLGVPKVASNLDLVRWFEKQPVRNVGETIKALEFMMNREKKLFKNDARRKQWYSQLLKTLDKVVDHNIEVRYITKDTNPADLHDLPKANARGTYVSNSKGTAIYIRGVEFEASGLTPETLIHELVHAALVHSMRDELDKAAADSNYTSDALTHIRDLERIMGVVRDKVNADPALKTKYAAAVSNVDEFVAWSMTNYGFQKEVLHTTTLKVDPKREDSALWTAAKGMIAALKGIFYKGSSLSVQQQTSVAFVQVINDVSALLHNAEQQNTTTQVAFNLSHENTQNAEIDRFNAGEIVQALDGQGLSSTFKTHLHSVIKKMEFKLDTAFKKMKDELRVDQARTPMDVWAKMLATDNAPFGSMALNVFSSTQQEAFAVEQLELLTRELLNRHGASATSSYVELEKLFMEAKKKLTPADFASQEEYDAVFSIVPELNGQSNHLASFVALGLGNERFHKLLGFQSSEATENAPKTFAARLQRWFEKALQFFVKRATKTYDGQIASDKLETLLDNMMDSEAKYRTQIKKEAAQKSLFEGVVEDKALEAMDYARKQVIKTAKSKFIKGSNKTAVKLFGNLANIVASDRVDVFMDHLKKMGNHMRDGRTSMVGGLLQNLTGFAAWAQNLNRETKKMEGARKDVITATAKSVLAAFKDAGEHISDRQRTAITKVLLRTGAHNLMGRYTLVDLDTLLTDKAVRTKAIEATIKKLQGHPKLINTMVGLADVLGNHLATGQTPGWLMMNAHQIAKLAGTPYATKVNPEHIAANTEVLKELVTLIGLHYTSIEDRRDVQQVLRTELQRNNGENGVEFVLGVAKAMEKESLEKLFKNNPTQMIHGYVSEVFNPNIEVQVANEVEGQWLTSLGYVKVGPVQRDVNDPDKTHKDLYVLRDGGMGAYVSGSISLSAPGTRGANSQLHNGYMNIRTEQGQENALKQSKMTGDKYHLLHNHGWGKFTNVTTSHMAPIYNEMGDVVNWRYLMYSNTKDKILERDNRFDKVLGTTAGSIFDKEASPVQNRNVLEALREDYEKNFEDMPNQYVQVGRQVDNEEMREIWNMLPETSKRDAKEIFGEDAVWVHKDLLDITFGYRKLSAANMFDDVNKLRKELKDMGNPDFYTEALTKVPFHKRMAVITIEGLLAMYARLHLGMDWDEAQNYSMRAAVMVSRAEDMWQEVVKEIKDIIVIKSGVVMVGNIWSNLTLLNLQGVPLHKIAKDHLVAMRAATRYQADQEELAKLNIQLSAGLSTNNIPELNQRIAQLQDSINRNPVKELIDAGLMPTIVEDVKSDDDIYSYKSRLQRKTKKLTDKVPESLRKVGKTVYMTHDTPLYQGLYRTTQLSDFVARYTLYQHLINDKKNPMSKADAIQKASDAFVNYDIPMQQGLQYMDDMGFMTFIKYFFRIQKVLFNLTKEKPLRVLSYAALGQLMDLGPTVLETSMLGKIGNNPLSMGALQFPGLLDNIATVTFPTAVVKGMF